MYKRQENDKVMQTKNNGKASNGDIGFIRKIAPDDKNEMKVTIEFAEDRVVEYGLEDMANIELAYATTIHKAMGFEYDIVILPIIRSHAIMLKRNFVYTAITRAKRRVFLVGQKGMCCFARMKKQGATAQELLHRAALRWMSIILWRWTGAETMTPYFTDAIILISRISFSALALRKKWDLSVTFRWSRRIWRRQLSTSAPGTTMNIDCMSALICWLWKITSGVLCRWYRRKRNTFPSFGGRAAFTSFLYLKDRASNVYIYLDELGAAVESEYAYACDENGEQIAFSVTEAKRLPVLSMEAALEQLSMI